MKKIISKLLFSIILILFPIVILADENFSISSSSLNIEVGSTKTFTITATNIIGNILISSSDNSIAALNLDEWNIDNSQENHTKDVTVTGITTGNAIITISVNATTANGQNINEQKTINVTVKNVSSNNSLSSIKIDDQIISGFNSLITSYNLNINESSINISATPEDPTAKVTDIGLKTLNYGSNKIEITVTAENGNVKTYTLNITRKDTRDTNNNLSTLTIDKGNFSFDKNKTNYTLIVDSDIEKITINATPESDKARIEGHGLKTLKYGDNKFEIKVYAENGNLKTYKLTINREDPRDTNNYLSDLSIDGIKIPFNKNVLSYSLNADNDVEKININAISESDKAKITGAGEKTLKIGENRFEIVVTSENESNKTYTIVITRLEKGQVPDDVKYIKSLTIDGIELEFDQSIIEYSLSLKDEDSLKFNYELEDDVIASVEGNENLKNGSVIVLKVTKGINSREYKFNIIKDEEEPVEIKKNKSKVWIIILVISGLLILGLIVLFIKLKKKKNNVEVIPETPTPNILNTEFHSDDEFKDIEKFDI